MAESSESYQYAISAMVKKSWGINDLAAIKKGTVQKLLVSTEATQIRQTSYIWYSYVVGDDILLLQILYIENHIALGLNYLLQISSETDC